MAEVRQIPDLNFIRYDKQKLQRCRLPSDYYPKTGSGHDIRLHAEI